MDIIKRIFSRLKPYRTKFIIAICLALLGNCTRLILPIFTRMIINDIITDGKMQLLTGVVSAILALTVLRASMGYIRAILFETVSQNFNYDMRTELYDHLQQMPFEFYDKHRVGEIMSRMTGDLDGVRNLIAGGVTQIIEQSVFFVGSLIFTFCFLSWKLSLIFVVTAPLVAFLGVKFRKYIRPAFVAIREQNAVLNNRAQENISGMRVVKAFAREEHEKELFHNDNYKKTKLQLAATAVWVKYNPILEFTAAICLPVLLLIGGYMVYRGTMDLGTLVAFTGYIWMINSPMRQLGMILGMLTQSTASAEKLFYYLDLGANIKEKEDAAFPAPFRGHVKFENVSFSYGDARVLQNIDLDVPPGKTVAVMGATGSGKTTLVNLLGRFYDVRVGSVSIDGIDVRDMKLKELRKQIGYVNQETFLFSETLENNINYGRPGAPHEKVEVAARIAQATEFVSEMPLGYETIVGERGMGLSGGQKQRTAIARAMLIDPTILILDDSTSAVDMETEFAIQKELEVIMQNRTTFIIAHRISSVKNADEIIILENGIIAERGKHDDLLAKKGLYYNMFMDQYRDFEELGA